MAATPSGKGYWLVGSDGGVFAYGDATFLGSMGDKSLNKPIVSMAATPSGKGYWLVGSDGGVFAYGDATFLGSMGDKVINGWIVGISPTKNGKGYYLQGSDGAIYAFGNATYQGGLYFPPPSISLTSNPTPVWSGSPETISWNVANAAGATIYLSGDGVLNSYGAIDSAKVNPHNLGLSTYTLTVIGAGGTDNLPFQINVVVPPPVVNIYAVGNVITWNVSNVANASLKITDLKGNLVYGPNTVDSSGAYKYNGSPGDFTATISASNTTWADSNSVNINIPSIPPASTDISSKAAGGASGVVLTPEQAKFLEGLGKKQPSTPIQPNKVPSSADCIVWYLTRETNGNTPIKKYTSDYIGSISFIDCGKGYSADAKIKNNSTKDHYQWNGNNYQ